MNNNICRHSAHVTSNQILIISNYFHTNFHQTKILLTYSQESNWLRIRYTKFIN